MNDSNTNQNTEQQTAATPTPEAAGDQGEKLFTQADLDRIIGERLSRERAKAEPSPEDAREADLKAREARLECREYISGEGFPDALLDLFDTSDAEAFKAMIQRLDGIVRLPSPKRPFPRIVAPMGNGAAPVSRTDALISEAFKPPKI